MEKVLDQINASKDVKTLDPEELEEERRLFYVGMTRARNRLFISAANYYGEGKRERKLSPFVQEALFCPYLKFMIFFEQAPNANTNNSFAPSIILPVPAAIM